MIVHCRGLSVKSSHASKQEDGNNVKNGPATQHQNLYPAARPMLSLKIVEPLA
jgi:hypothetical protein